MKKLLFVCVGLLGLCTLGQVTAKADVGDDDYYRPRRPVYREHYERRDRCDDRETYYRPQRRVVVREYYTPAPRYYEDDCRPRYRHHRSHVNFFLPLPPLPF